MSVWLQGPESRQALHLRSLGHSPEGPHFIAHAFPTHPPCTHSQPSGQRSEPQDDATSLDPACGT
jgi:hypothetical protein